MGRGRGYREKSKEDQSDEGSNLPSFFSDEEGDETPPISSQSDMMMKDEYSLSPFKRKSISKKKAKSSTSQLQQMTLDLGQKMRIDCGKCGMSYDRTCSKDVQMHNRYHSTVTQGMEWCLRNPNKKGKLIGEHKLPKSSIDAYTIEHGKSCEYEKEVQIWTFAVGSRKQDPSTLSILQSIQNTMDSALGAVSVELDAPMHRTDNNKESQQKLIVAVWRDRVVGSALVGELPTSVHIYRISSEMEKAVVLNTNDNLAPEKVPLAVHRIHVISILRRSGIASAMLDAALNDCVYGMDRQEVIRTIGKGLKANTIAFSQPTESGRLLAQRWIVEESGESSDVLVFEDDL